MFECIKELECIEGLKCIECLKCVEVLRSLEGIKSRMCLETIALSVLLVSRGFSLLNMFRWAEGFHYFERHKCVEGFEDVRLLGALSLERVQTLSASKES